MFQTKTQIVILNDILTFKQANKQKTEREKIKGKKVHLLALYELYTLYKVIYFKVKR